MVTAARFEIDAGPGSVQQFAPLDKGVRFEGVAFSPSGAVLGTVTADSNMVLIFRRRGDGRFDETPFCRIEGRQSGLEYPHDLAFSLTGDGLLLAVAQRGGAVAIFRRNEVGGTYGPAPVAEIRGTSAQLEHSDGVAFVPPDDAYLAVCNLTQASITFHRRLSSSPLRFSNVPAFVLRHSSLQHPDGVALSSDGNWLATANHAGHTVSIFRRRRQSLFRKGIAFGPEPVSVIDDPTLCHPHSVAFSPLTGHIAVTNAGANFFSVYPPSPGGGAGWSPEPVLRQTVNAEKAFRRVNMENRMEGGPKGIAIAPQSLAICSPEIGLKIYPVRERST